MKLSIVSYADSDESLVEGFRRIYMDAFPDVNEREPYENIKKRISSSDSRPGTVACILTDEGEVVGGLLSDFYVYDDSPVFDVEAIYIAVAPDARRRGYGRKLLTDGLALSVSRLETLTGRKLRNIYFETENPFKVRKESFDPISRLNFFCSLGAMRIPIDYRQPPLDDDSDWADNLFLMVLPHPGREPERSVDKNDLEEFLTAFYDGLGVSDPSCYEAFRNETDRIAEVGDTGAENLVISLDPLRETSSFEISDVSVLSHYKMKGCSFMEEDSSELKGCQVFESYECDLMDYAHQERGRRPFRTYHIKSYRNIRLGLPRFYSYTSEGHTFYRLSGADALDVDISLNCSSRGVSVGADERYIVSLVVRPAEGASFDELSLIKLVTLFGSRQENYFAYPNNKFTDLCVTVGDGSQPMSIFEFIGHYMADCGEGLKGVPQFECCHTGATELELSSVRRAGDNARIFSDFDGFYKTVASSSPEESLWNKTLCGILLGIFDFGRMNSAEIFDTIKPMVERKDSFMMLCRGHLAKVCFEQDKERVENIFISPYLMIPDVALVYNEMVLDNCEAELADIKQDGSDISFRYYERIKRDTQKLQDIRNKLTLQYIPDCFNYSSEREIFSSGGANRGLNVRLDRLRKSMGMVKDDINQRKSRYSVFIETVQNCILVILAILQVYTAVNRLHGLFIAFLALTLIFGADIAYKKLKE